MYKDKQKQREANRLASQKRRTKGMTEGMTGISQGISGPGVTGMTEGEGMTEGMTRIEYIQSQLNDPFLIRGIESAARIFDDRDKRYEKAYRYNQWKAGLIPSTYPYPQSH